MADTLLKRSSFGPISVLILLALGCSSPQSSEPKRPSETVDVPPALEIPIENDEVAVARTVDLSGIMPSNFPEGLPLHTPSSLVNFGDDDEGAWVDLLTDDPRIHVERSLTDQLSTSGWSSQPVSGAIELRKGSRRVKLMFREGNPGTIYRYEY